MPAGASDPRLRALLDADLGSGTPATWYVGALLALPAADGTSYTEVSGGAAARVAMTNSATNWPAATTVSGVTSKANGVAITYPNPTADWGLVLAWGLFTVATLNTGVCAYSNLLDSPITVKSGLSPVQFDIGQMVLANARPS